MEYLQMQWSSYCSNFTSGKISKADKDTGHYVRLSKTF